MLQHARIARIVSQTRRARVGARCTFAREAHRASAGVDPDLDAVRVVDRAGLERVRHRRERGARVRGERIDGGVDDAPLDERLVALDVDDDVGVEPARDLSEPVGPVSCRASVMTTSAPKARHARAMRSSSVATSSASSERAARAPRHVRSIIATPASGASGLPGKRDDAQRAGMMPIARMLAPAPLRRRSHAQRRACYRSLPPLLEKYCTDSCWNLDYWSATHEFT